MTIGAGIDRETYGESANVFLAELVMDERSPERAPFLALVELDDGRNLIRGDGRPNGLGVDFPEESVENKDEIRDGYHDAASASRS